VPSARWIGTVHHGLPKESLAPRSEEGKYLAFLGRVSPEKRLDQAIEAQIEAAITTVYLTRERPTLSRVFRQITEQH